MTSGRQRAMACAMACEPSICLSKGGLLLVRHVVGGARGGDVALAHLAAELLADSVGDRFEAHLPRDRGERAQQSRVGKRTSDVLQREIRCGHYTQVARGKLLREFGDAELLESARRVDEDVSGRREAA